MPLAALTTVCILVSRNVLCGDDTIKTSGERVWANPRAIMAMMRQCNTVDVTRRSPSYEVRLAKYSKRGFEIYVPNLMRKDIDPTVRIFDFFSSNQGKTEYCHQIYERSILKIEGLARLLALEKLHSADARYKFLDSRRELRGRPFALRQPKNRKQRKYRGDLKKMEIGGLEMNDYDVASLHIPYGPGWTSQRIEKLIYQTVRYFLFYNHGCLSLWLRILA